MPRRSVEELDSPPAKRRPLRSNSDHTDVGMTPPPPEFKDVFFTKDFGINGIFVGTCLGVRKGAHRYTGEDVFCVLYDDGDIEEASHRSVERLIEFNRVNVRGKLEPKLTKALKALKSHLANPAPGSPHIDPRERENDTDAATATVTSPPPGPRKKQVAPPASAPSSPPPRSPPPRSPPPRPTPSRIVTRVHTPRPSPGPLRAASPQSATDMEFPSDTPLRKPLQKSHWQLVTASNSAWDGDRTAPVLGIVSRREVPVVEYQVKWGGDRRGREAHSWLPAPQIHTQLVSKFEAAVGKKSGLVEHAPAPTLTSQYREILTFMEPPSWASTSRAVSSVPDHQLVDFPLPQFLDAYMFHTLERLDEFQVRIRAAEERTAKAEAELRAVYEEKAAARTAAFEDDDDEDDASD